MVLSPPISTISGSLLDGRAGPVGSIGVDYPIPVPRCLWRRRENFASGEKVAQAGQPNPPRPSFDIYIPRAGFLAEIGSQNEWNL